MVSRKSGCPIHRLLLSLSGVFFPKPRPLPVQTKRPAQATLERGTRFLLGLRRYLNLPLWSTSPRLSQLMPWGLKRYQDNGDLHFITFSCYQRRPLLERRHAQPLFESALEQARINYGFGVLGYVIMPEHVHLLMSEPDRGTVATAIKAMKQSVARKLVGRGGHFWQERYYDFNVRTGKKRIEKVRIYFTPQTKYANMSYGKHT
jgi:putative transposase